MNTLVMWYRKQLLPRLFFIPFWIVWVALLPFRARSRSRDLASRVCIEAGVRGWESIEFKELYSSACEFLGEPSVKRLVVVKDRPYVEQVREAVSGAVTHYVYDARTGAQGWWHGMWEAIRVAWLLNARGVVPIVLLSDQAVRIWRAKSAIVSAHRGVVIIFISARRVASIFPHRRILGPSVMPLSRATFDALRQLPSADEHHPALFVGSLYEPRTTMLNEIARRLQEGGLTLEIRGRRLGSARISDEEYWAAMARSPAVITTADQLVTRETDWTWIPHMVYRYLEVAACGTLLVAPDVPGVRRYFEPGVHFAAFTTVEDAVRVLMYYLTHPAERQAVAARGLERAQGLIESRSFWSGVDVALGPDSLT